MNYYLWRNVCKYSLTAGKGENWLGGINVTPKTEKYNSLFDSNVKNKSFDQHWVLMKVAFISKSYHINHLIEKNNNPGLVRNQGHFSADVNKASGFGAGDWIWEIKRYIA